jgi:uncharacterized protein (TIGR00375 family)
MQIIADLHIHSKYSRAVSQKMDLNEISSWASKKGIQLAGTSDWTHPLWIREIKTKLKEVNQGIYALKEKPFDQGSEVYFILTTEISSIYVQGGKQRRVHNLIFSPSVETVEKVIKEFQKKGTNLMSDGRPITGISSHDLLSMLLEVDEDIILVPCHVWTPWFSLYGSKSGFDSIEECFGELSQYIYGVETGLSSDPIMNWQIKELETRSILSSSDAHSGPKLGREATVFVGNNKDSRVFSYRDIIDAIKQDPKGKLKIGYTIEFFPEEGKYHWSGHRSCGIRYSPKEVKEKGVVCPVCRKSLTIGVENRVVDLADEILDTSHLHFLQNKAGLIFVYDHDKERKPFVSIVPLIEVLTEIYNSPTRALDEFERLSSSLGTEFDILLRLSYDEILRSGGQKLTEAIKIIRERRVHIDPGYDGVFGHVKVFNSQDEEKPVQDKLNENKQPSLF